MPRTGPVRRVGGQQPRGALHMVCTRAGCTPGRIQPRAGPLKRLCQRDAQQGRPDDGDRLRPAHRRHEKAARARVEPADTRNLSTPQPKPSTTTWRACATNVQRVWRELNENDDVVGSAEAAKMLRTSLRTVQRKAHSGELDSEIVGGSLVFKRAAVEATEGATQHMSDESFESLWHQAIENHVAGMSDPDLAARGLARVQATTAPAPQPAVDQSNLPLGRRSGFAQKCGQLADLAAAAKGRAISMASPGAVHAYGGMTRPPNRSPNPLRSKAQRRFRLTGVKANRVAAHRCPKPRAHPTAADRRSLMKKGLK